LPRSLRDGKDLKVIFAVEHEFKRQWQDRLSSSLKDMFRYTTYAVLLSKALGAVMKLMVRNVWKMNFEKDVGYDWAY